MMIFSTNDLGKVTSQALPEIEVFKHIHFNHTLGDRNRGGDDEGTSFRTTFNVDLQDHELSRNISSFIIYSGYWQFFQGSNFQQPFPHIFGPGQYITTADFGIPNDSIVSFKCVAFQQPVHPDLIYSDFKSVA